MSGRHLLIVEDDQPLASTLAYAMKAQGWKVTATADSGAVTEMVQNLPIAVVLMDYQLGEQETGLDVAQKLRALQLDLPIVLMSGKAYAIDRNRAGLLGIQQILSKPFGMEEIRDALGSEYEEIEQP